ncbi:glycosyltransferase family 2 protein [Candidatus Omnitrophota bacterium]
MNSNPTYSVVIPVYNEETVLPDLYNRLKPVMEKFPDPYEIIFVNDGSTDNSQSILEGMARRDDSIVVVKFSKNFGQHPAMTSGYIESRGEIVISLDSDLQNPPEEIPKLIEELNKGYDMVSGRRKDRKDNFFRMAPSKMVNLIISLMTGVKMQDYGSGLRAFKSDTAKQVAKEFLANRVYLSMLIPAVTKNIKEIEVEHDERLSGESKYDLWKLLTTFCRIFLFRGRSSSKGSDHDDSYETWVESVTRDKARWGDI